MPNQSILPKLSLTRIIFMIIGLMLVGVFLFPSSVKAGSTPASSESDCINVVHQHYFDQDSGTCLNGRAPLVEEESPPDTSSIGTANEPVLGLIPVPSGFPTNPSDIIASAVTVLIGFAGLIFFIVLLLGGLRYLTAGGDEKATMAARQTLTNAFIGLIIVVASFLIAQILFAVFGLDTLVNVI